MWARDPRWDVKGPQLDGIAILADGVYANIFEGDGLYRVAMNPDGSAGAITKLKPRTRSTIRTGCGRSAPTSC